MQAGFTKRLADGCSKDQHCVFSVLDCVMLQRGSSTHPSASHITIRFALELADKPYELPATSNASRITIRLADGCSEGPRCIFSALDYVKLQHGSSEHPSISRITIRLALELTGKAYDLPAKSNLEVVNAIRAIYFKQFLRLPPWGKDYMQAHELMSSIQYDGKALLTDKDGSKVVVMITTDIINEALHFYLGTYDLLAKTKSIDNEKADIPGLHSSEATKVHGAVASYCCGHGHISGRSPSHPLDKNLEEQRATTLAREKITEGLKRKVEEPVLELQEGNPKKPKQVEEENIENIQMDPTPPSPSTTAPPVSPPLSPKSPSSPKPPPSPKSPSIPNSSQQNPFVEETSTQSTSQVPKVTEVPKWASKIQEKDVTRSQRKQLGSKTKSKSPGGCWNLILQAHPKKECRSICQRENFWSQEHKCLHPPHQSL
ncbi:hypothetical protein L7F22_063238 [Adiantum nelumboides]|nr:hypothetical protein [Adiantum nelumboides]